MEDVEREEETPRRCTRQSLCTYVGAWLTWFCVLAVYLLLGGLVFSLAERPNEVDTISQANARREELQTLLDEAMENITAAFRGGNVTGSEAEELVWLVANVSASLALASQELPGEESPLWTYSPSIFFCSTVVTTIGYGTTAPVTDLGRTLFVFYALIGIPICLVFLSHVGDLLSRRVDSVIGFVARKTKTIPAKHQNTIVALVSLTLFLIGLLLFIFIPSIVFSSIEGWTYGESVYYCFVTLTTVGFGDFVAARTAPSETRAFYRICSAVWVMVGLAWIALLITKTQTFFGSAGDRIHTRMRKMKEKKRKKKEQDYEVETATS